MEVLLFFIILQLSEEGRKLGAAECLTSCHMPSEQQNHCAHLFYQRQGCTFSEDEGPWWSFKIASLVSQLVKNPPALQETWVRSLRWEDPQEKGKATNSSILAWRIPWTVVHGVTESRTVLSDFHLHFHFPGGPMVSNLPGNVGDIVQSLVLEDSTCLGATKPVHHNC